MRPAGFQGELAGEAAEDSAPCADQGQLGEGTETFQGSVGDSRPVDPVVSCFLQATARAGWAGPFRGFPHYGCESVLCFSPSSP